MNLKALEEKRMLKQAEIQTLIETITSEERAFTKEEDEKFTNLEKEIKEIDHTLELVERARANEPKKIVGDTKKSEELTAEQRAQADEDAFLAYVRNTELENRAATNLTKTDNGAVVPSSIANKIIEKVVDICPIYQMADRYQLGGTLTIPYYDESTTAITMAYSNEFSALTSTSGKFTNISLTGYLAGALTKVSESLLNNSNFALLQFIINAMAKAIAKFIEKELLVGTTGKVTGMQGVTQSKTTASATAITSDELIDTQDLVPDEYQANAVWIMNRTTRSAIRKLKDGQGNYLLQKDFTAKWGYTLLGKDVYCSDNMPGIAAGKTVAYYGELDGLAVKVSEDVSIKVLREKYADEHAIGVIGWVEIDSKVENAQKLSELTMKTA